MNRAKTKNLSRFSFIFSGSDYRGVVLSQSAGRRYVTRNCGGRGGGGGEVRGGGVKVKNLSIVG